MSLSKRIKRLRYLPKYLSDKAAFQKAGGIIAITYPVYDDFKEILGWSKNLFELIRFDYVDDKGNLRCNASLASPLKVSYGCDIYTLKKIN